MILHLFLATQEVFEVDAAALQSVAQTSQSPTTSIAHKELMGL